MRKHGVVLDISCDKLALWPGHCQHPGSLSAAVNTRVESYLSTSATMPLATHAANSTTSAGASAEPQKVRTKSKKAKPVGIPWPIPGVRPAYRCVSKLAVSEREKYVVPAKRILKPTTSKPKAEPVDETKPIDLAFIGATPFQYLAKQKDVENFAISIRHRPENEDAHFIKPDSTGKVLEAALRMTRVHYMNPTGIFTPSPPSSRYYMTQWRFIQDQLNVHWITAGLSKDLKLFILGSWSSGLENWKYPDE